ncbi:MAG: dTDP-4-dehydrorhamnose 3,5-epimerase [Gammaproteobacteria bacterium]|nr:dTDP-4-dehydrorhamnose 3,5-epimerase [Gammaproteobacteria bacterium]
MKLIPTAIPEVILIEPKVLTDSRGFFLESWNRQGFAAQGLALDFVQDNHSRSHRGVLRGLHYQLHKPQGKLVRVICGEVFDVAVDLRQSSPTFGHWVGVHLSEDNPRMLWIPPGFAHGFLVLSASADFFYKCTDYYAPEDERCIRWDDPHLNIAWPLKKIGTPILSSKDSQGQAFAEAEVYTTL